MKDSTPTRETGAQLLARIKPRLARDSTMVCLRPDLLGGWEKAQKDLAKAEDQLTDEEQKYQAAGRLGQSSTPEVDAATARVRELAEKVVELEADIEATQVEFTFEGMPKDVWNELCEQHPPRPDNMYDQMAGYDRAAVPEHAVRISLVDPVFEECQEKGCSHDDCGTWQQLVRFISPTEWTEMKQMCDRVNGAYKAPKSQLASRILGQHSNDSAPLAAGE